MELLGCEERSCEMLTSVLGNAHAWPKDYPLKKIGLLKSLFGQNSRST